jgi:soluble lytic murein transglycosylase-like protein
MTSVRRRTVYGIGLAALTGVLFTAGAGTALAPRSELAAGCIAPQDKTAILRVQADEPALSPQQQALVGYLSRRFTISALATERMVEAAHRAAREVGLDPLLILAVISVESRFNPIAQSSMGAVGLMQIIPKFHLDKLEDFGGEAGALDPENNILAGARILQEYVYRTGTLEAGLQFYNGAMSDNSAQYAQKVLLERQRIESALTMKGA